MTQEPENHERLREAVKTRQERRARWKREGERPLGQNLAMIGVLGWTIVLPTLLGIFAAAGSTGTSTWEFSGPSACLPPGLRLAAHSPGRGCIANDPRSG